MGQGRISRVVAVCLVATLLAGCGLFGGGDEQSPSPSAPASSRSSSAGPGGLPEPVARKILRGTSYGEDTAKEEDTFITWEFEVVVYGVYRQGDQARLLMGARLLSDVGENNQAGLSLTYQMQHTVSVYDLPSTDPANDLTLIDPAALKAYLVARDAEGDCLCPEEVVLVNDQPPLVFGARFAAPPQDVKSIDVSTPSMGYFRDIPVMDAAPPQIDPDSVKYQYDAPVSTADPARADIVPISGQVSNLDLSVTKSRDKVTLDANVLFEFDKATLTPKAKSRIAEAAATLKERAKGQKVQVNGYTDSKGSSSYNKRLSQRRAAAVKKALEPQLKGTGITLVAAGKGEADPVAPNQLEEGKDNPEGRKLNRRVEIVYRK